MKVRNPPLQLQLKLISETFAGVTLHMTNSMESTGTRLSRDAHGLFRCCLKNHLGVATDLCQPKPLPVRAFECSMPRLALVRSVRDAPRKYTSNKWIGMFFASGKWLVTMASPRILPFSHAEVRLTSNASQPNTKWHDFPGAAASVE